MIILIFGLLVLLGVHSIPMFAPHWRANVVARLGLLPWKGLFAIASLAGFVLIVWGYGQARMDPFWLWYPPVWTRHLAALLVLPAFVLVVAAYVPGNRIKARLGHPMVLGVKIWALAHLLSNGTLAALLLFGSFLAWAIVNFAKSRRRDRVQGVTRTAIGFSRDVIVIILGLVAWAAFAFYFHELLIGVRPMG